MRAHAVARTLLAGWGDVPGLQDGIPAVGDQAAFALIVVAVLPATWAPDSLGGELKRWMHARTGALTGETWEDVLPGTAAPEAYRSIQMVLAGSGACQLPRAPEARRVRVNKLLNWVRGAVWAAARA